MKTIVLIIITLMLSVWLSAPCLGDSLVNVSDGGGYINLFGSNRASRIGDIVTITFNEKTVATQGAKGKMKNTYNNNVSAGRGLLDFFLGGGLSGGENTDVETTTIQSHSLATTVTARVEEVLPGGNLVIIGTRNIEVNHENQKLTITGVIRPTDIRHNNTIDSTRIADMTAIVNGLPIDRSTKRRRGGVIRWVWGLLF